MADEPNRNRFIPFRKADIVSMCCKDSRMDAGDALDFQEFCRILEALFHFEFHQNLEALKNCYAPFNPDADTQLITEYSPEEKQQLQKKLVAEMTAVLNSANFEQITAEDLNQALAEESLLKIRLEVDFEDFDEVIFFRRGESVKQETLVSFYGLRKNTFKFTNYDRVAVYLKFKEKQYFDNVDRKNLNFEPGSTIIKLFHNVPKAYAKWNKDLMRWVRKESMDVNRAKETLEATQLQLEELDQRLQEDIDRIEADLVPDEENIQEVLVKPKSSDMTLEFFGLVWMPYRRDARGQLSPDWE